VESEVKAKAMNFCPRAVLGMEDCRREHHLLLAKYRIQISVISTVGANTAVTKFVMFASFMFAAFIYNLARSKSFNIGPNVFLR